MKAEVRKHKLDAGLIKGLQVEQRPYRVWDTEITGYFIQVSATGSKTFRLRYKVNGIAKEYTLGKYGKLTAKTAREFAGKKVAEVTLGKDIQLEKKLEKQKAQAAKYNTLGGFIHNKYEPWITSERKTGHEIVKLLKSKFGYLYSKSLTDVTPWDIQRWRTEARKRGLKPATLNRQIALFKSVFSRAVEWGDISVNPLASVKPVKIDIRKVVRYLSPEEEESLRQALRARDHALKLGRESANEWRRVRGLDLLPSIINQAYADYLEPVVILALNTGMRRGEILGLRWSEVDLNNRNITIKGESAKSGSTRHIPLNDEAFRVLDAWLNESADSELVFPNPTTGEKIGSIKKSWGKLISYAKIVNFRFHDLRHTFASKLVMAGVDLNTVRELLGHSNIDMTLRYAHLAPEHKAAAVALLVNNL